jgi:hypothetical protein
MEGKSDEEMGEFLFDTGHSVGFSLRMFGEHKRYKDKMSQMRGLLFNEGGGRTVSEDAGRSQSMVKREWR